MGGSKGSRIAAASHDPGIRRHPVPPAPIHLSQDTSQKLSIHSRIETQGKAARNLTCSFLRTASNWVHINGRMRLFVKMRSLSATPCAVFFDASSDVAFKATQALEMTSQARRYPSHTRLNEFGLVLHNHVSIMYGCFCRSASI